MEVCIVGAGIAGLTCARLLSKSGVKVTVIEARDRLGGRIHTWDLSSQSTYSSTDEEKGKNLVDLGGSFVHGDIGNPLTALQKDVSPKIPTFEVRAQISELLSRQDITSSYLKETLIESG